MTDPGNWITVVENTGELKTANTIDRESPLVHKDMYNITIRAVDESESGLYVTYSISQKQVHPSDFCKYFIIYFHVTTQKK